MLDINNLSNLVGGTLVEYLARARFTKEWGRATIISVTIDVSTDEIRVTTDNHARLLTAEFSHALLARVDDVIYLIPSSSSWLDFYFALAPKGVKIPTPDERSLNWNPFKSSD